MTHRMTIVLGSLFAASLAGTAAGATLRAVDVAPLAAITGEGEILPSEARGALDRPDMWKCDRIYPDYQRWLEEGKAAEDWKFVGHTYRDSRTNELYDWQDWLDWADDAGCVAAPPTDSANLAVGGAIAALGAGLLVATSGSGSKSPG